MNSASKELGVNSKAKEDNIKEKQKHSENLANAIYQNISTASHSSLPHRPQDSLPPYHGSLLAEYLTIRKLRLYRQEKEPVQSGHHFRNIHQRFP